MAEERQAAAKGWSRSLQKLRIDDGQEVTLRVFLPEGGGRRKPAVVMVCGLLWLGGPGILGQIGLGFNDAFGRAFARHGVPCVQLHTPGKLLGRTRLVDAVVLLLLCVCLACNVSRPAVATVPVAWLLLVHSWSELLVSLLIAGGVSLPLFHFAEQRVTTPREWVLFVFLLHIGVRMAQRAAGGWGDDGPADYMRAAEGAVAWTEGNRELLGSDGRLVLCGYSSGGHVAALLGLAQCEAEREGGRRFEAVVLISGLYDLRTETLKGPARAVAPALGFVFGDILGLAGERERREASPAALVRSGQQKRLDAGCPWWVLSATKELMGLWPLEGIVFGCSDFVDGLAAKGADVRRAECGYNHWLLVFSFDAFARSFCETV